MAEPLRVAARPLVEPDSEEREVQLAAARRASLAGQIKALTRELRVIERAYGFRPVDLS